MFRILGGVFAVLVAFLLVNFPASFTGLGRSEIQVCATFAVFVGVGLMASQFSRTMIRRH